MNLDKKIKEIYNDLFCIADIPETDRFPMNEWYNQLINKNYHQLDLFDVTRMVIQKIYLELAIKKSISFINENPFCGQRYEGELLELLSRLDKSYLNSYKDTIIQILSKALAENKTYDWLSEDERIEFGNTVNLFKQKLQAKCE